MNFTFEEEGVIRCYMKENRIRTVAAMNNAIPYLKGTAHKLVVQAKDKLENTSNLEYEQLYERLLLIKE